MIIISHHSIGLSYVMTPEEVKFIQRALVFVSEDGWKFLPEYVFFEDTGEWRHKSMKNKKPFRRWLNDVRLDYWTVFTNSFPDGHMSYPVKAHEVNEFRIDSSYLSSLFESYYEQAKATLAITEKSMLAPTYVVSEYSAANVKNEQSVLVTQYRWYVTRIEAYQDFKSNYTPSKNESILPSILIHVEQRGDQSVSTESHHDLKSLKRASSEVSTTPNHDASTGTPTNVLGPNTSAPSTNAFTVKISDKKQRRESCMLSSTGKEVVPLSVVSIAQEPGVEFKYHTGVDGTLEFTAIVPGMEFKERVKYMKKHKELFPEVPTRLMKLMGILTLIKSYFRSGRWTLRYDQRR